MRVDKIRVAHILIKTKMKLLTNGCMMLHLKYCLPDCRTSGCLCVVCWLIDFFYSLGLELLSIVVLICYCLVLVIDACWIEGSLLFCFETQETDLFLVVVRGLRANRLLMLANFTETVFISNRVRYYSWPDILGRRYDQKWNLNGICELVWKG